MIDETLKEVKRLKAINKRLKSRIKEIEDSKCSICDNTNCRGD